MRRPQYRPPPRPHRIRVRDPADKPPAIRDRFGRPMPTPEYGVEVWASVRDRRVVAELADGIETRGAQTVFTIRYRELPADFSVIFEGVEFLSIGAPIERGEGLRAVFLELWTERRQRAAA